MYRPLLIVASVLAAVVAFVALSASKQSRAPLRIDVSFTGYSNDAAGIRLATFALTNNSTVKVLEWGVYRIQSLHHTNDAIVYKPGSIRSTRLGPGQGEVFVFAAPSNQGSWRIQGYCSRVGLRQRLNDVVSEPFLPERFRGVPSDYWPRSEWIND
jgi:hypothetical protein